jgi:hypothetical protein
MYVCVRVRICAVCNVLRITRRFKTRIAMRMSTLALASFWITQNRKRCSRFGFPTQRFPSPFFLLLRYAFVRIFVE